MLKICSKISLCFACAMAIGVMVSKNEYYYLFIPCATLAHFIGEWLTDKSEEYDLRNPLPLDTSYSHNRTNSNSYCVEPMTEEEFELVLLKEGGHIMIPRLQPTILDIAHLPKSRPKKCQICLHPNVRET